MVKKLTPIIYTPLLIAALFIGLTSFTEPFGIKNGMLLVSILVFSPLFYMDFKRIFDSHLSSGNSAKLILLFLGGISGVIFSCVLLIPLYFFQISEILLFSLSGAIAFGAGGYLTRLLALLNSKKQHSRFACIRGAIAGFIVGAVICGVIGGSANIIVLFTGQ